MPTTEKRLTVGSLFSGIGGIDLGLELAGMQVLWQVENDQACQHILRLRWPHVTLHTDIRRKIPFEPVDMVAGGFPCQPVSNAGLRLGEDDPRWLWHHMLRVIKQVQPRWVLIENVEGLRTKGLGSVLKGLAESGYDAEWDCLPAHAVGAPHARYRFFIVAYPCGDGGSGGSGQQRLRLETASTGKNGSAARHFVTAADSNGDGSHGQGIHAVERSAIFQSAGDSRRGLGARRIETAGIEVDSYPHSARFQRLGDKRKLLQVDEEVSVSRFGWWQSEPHVGRVAYGVPNRVDRLRQLGNSVVPQLMEMIGRSIIEADANSH